jgi:hypothetical protein
VARTKRAPLTAVRGPRSWVGAHEVEVKSHDRDQCARPCGAGEQLVA